MRQALVPLTWSPKSCEQGRDNIQTGSKVSLCVSGLHDPCLKFIIHFKLKFRSFQISKFPSLNSFLSLAPIFFFHKSLFWSIFLVNCRCKNYGKRLLKWQHKWRTLCWRKFRGIDTLARGSGNATVTSGFPLLRPVALASSADNILLDLHDSSDHTQPGAHNSERVTFMRSCDGVFTDRFVFKTVLARILIIF